MVCGRLAAVCRGMCEKVASLALFDQFGFPRDVDGDGFAKEEVSGFKDLFHLVPGVVMDHNRHGVGLSGRIFQGTA